MGDYYTNDMGSLFIQPDGPNGQVFWLGCHDLGDMTEPNGDVSRTFCPDPSGRGRWTVATRSKGPGGEATVDVTFPIGKTADYMEVQARRDCPMTLYVNMSECGERNVFADFDSGTVIQSAIISSKARSNLVSRNADGGSPAASTKTFSLSFLKAEDFYSLVGTRWAHAAATMLLGIESAGRDRCTGACGASAEPCEVLISTDKAGIAAKTVPYYSTDYGVTWAAGGALNFLVDEDAGPIVTFPVSATVMRVMLACSETVAAQPAKVCYSDSATLATWTDVAVGATNTEFINDTFAWSQEAVYACTDTGGGAAGNVYKSTDGGLTWTQVLAGATDALNYITFVDAYRGLTVGDTNEIQWTADGGSHWTAITGPAAQAAVNCLSAIVLDDYRWFVGYDDGEIWYTQDGGTTWSQRVLPIPSGATAVASVNDMRAVDEYCLWVGVEVTVGGNPRCALMRSVNGGYSWESFVYAVDSAAGGMNCITACSYNRCYGAGGVVAATGLVFEAAEAV